MRYGFMGQNNDPTEHGDRQGQQGGTRQLTESKSPPANRKPSHIDFFSAINTSNEPEILSDGTSISWPSGWDEADACLWRRDHGLLPPA